MGVRARVLGWFAAPRVLRELALASLVANVVIVVTGGAVRLTSSGLGCPTWPQCTTSSLTPTKAYSFHGIIEFTNRQLTFILALIAALVMFAAYRQRREVRLAALALAGIPAQAVLGGITVLTDLNPWTVAAHFLLSMSIIAVTTLLWWRLRPPAGPEQLLAGPRVRLAALLARLVALAAAIVLTTGTIVTGSGPHAGDVKAGELHRIRFDAGGIAQLHADTVMILIGLTIGLVVLLYAVDTGAAARRAGWQLLGIEIAQGVIGFVQYFTHIPAGLVAVHMLGACLVWIAALQLLLAVQPAAPVRHPAPTAAGSAHR